jgi:hypothetical protein
MSAASKPLLHVRMANALHESMQPPKLLAVEGASSAWYSMSHSPDPAMQLLGIFPLWPVEHTTTLVHSCTTLRDVNSKSSHRPLTSSNAPSCVRFCALRDDR